MSKLLLFLLLLQNSKTQLICSQVNVTCSEMDLVKIYWDLNGRHQDDPYLINFIKENILIPPSSLPLQLKHGLSSDGAMKNLGGQYKQVPVVEDLLKLKHKLKTGFFLEAGAACGEYISNTLYLELKYQWTGLLVEPNPDMLKLLLSKHRNAWIFPHCLSTSNQVETVNFDASNYNSGIILEGKIKPSQIDRTKPPLPYEREIEMQCFPLNSVLKAMDNPIIDYFSLDIEGAEFAVLNSLPWKEVNITLVSVEINHAGDIFPGTRDDIKRLLLENAFEFVTTTTIDDFYLHKSFKRKGNKVKLEL